jgi:hypothetical protein
VTTKSTAISPMRRPDLFYDPKNELMYSLGGSAFAVDPDVIPWSNTSQQVQLWAFEPPNSSVALDWELQAVGSTATFPIDKVVAMALTATSPTNHYSLGGYDNANSLGLSEFLTYNFENQTWTNQTVNGKYYIAGQGHYIPSFGDDGVVIFLGGTWPSNGDVSSTSSLAGIDSVLIYDIHSNTFFNPQPTSSDANKAPLNRYDFCSVGTSGNESANSTYEM